MDNPLYSSVDERRGSGQFGDLHCDKFDPDLSRQSDAVLDGFGGEVPTRPSGLVYSCMIVVSRQRFSLPRSSACSI